MAVGAQLPRTAAAHAALAVNARAGALRRAAVLRAEHAEAADQPRGAAASPNRRHLPAALPRVAVCFLQPPGLLLAG